MKEYKGLRCEIYKSSYDSVRNVISHTKKEVVLCGKGIPELHTASEESPAVLLITEQDNGKQVPRAEPLFEGANKFWFCFGGNFIYSADSRFPYDHPIKLFEYRE